MIYKVEGDILLSKAQAIVQGVGVKDAMDQGLALKLSTRYPSLQKEFNLWCYQHDTKTGEAWMWVGQNDVRIVNLITHEYMHNSAHHHYCKATLINIKHALYELVKIIHFEKLTSIALPKIGTGLGDLDWDEVFPLIDNILGSLGILVYVYVTFQPGIAAYEPGLS